MRRKNNAGGQGPSAVSGTRVGVPTLTPTFHDSCTVPDTTGMRFSPFHSFYSDIRLTAN